MKLRINKKLAKILMTSLLTLSVLALALPCDCMALEETKPVENNLPCHSSTDDSRADSQEHEDCCCDGSEFSLALETNITVTSIQESSAKKDLPSANYVAINFLDSLSNYQALIRGSPPTENQAFYSTKTFLAFIQRWLI